MSRAQQRSSVHNRIPEDFEYYSVGHLENWIGIHRSIGQRRAEWSNDELKRKYNNNNDVMNRVSRKHNGNTNKLRVARGWRGTVKLCASLFTALGKERP